jgi:thymidine phosphorylase
VRLVRGVGETIRGGDPIYEIHAQSAMQLEAAEEYARSQRRIYAIE